MTRFLPLLLAALAPAAARADVTVAVAANFTEPARAIAAGFERAGGGHVTLAFASSGAFAAQIAHGAPFEVFLSADEERPAALERGGFGVPGSRFTYAVGRLVLYSADARLVDRHGAVLKRGGFARLAIAEPSAAPYGLAAIETMRRLGVLDAVQPRIVRGSSITQAYDFVASGAAELGFVALSQLTGIPGGSRWIVPERMHDPIAQGAILLKAGAADPAARAFLAYLRSAPARAIMVRFGYALPR